jgi:ribosomal protein S27AE
MVDLIDVLCSTCNTPITITAHEAVGRWQCGTCANLPWPRQLPNQSTQTRITELFDIATASELDGTPHQWWHQSTRVELINQALRLVTAGVPDELAISTIVNCWAITGNEYGD